MGKAANQRKKRDEMWMEVELRFASAAPMEIGDTEELGNRKRLNQKGPRRQLNNLKKKMFK